MPKLFYRPFCLYISKASETLRKHFSWKSQKVGQLSHTWLLVLPAQPLALAQNVQRMPRGTSYKSVEKNGIRIPFFSK